MLLVFVRELDGLAVVLEVELKPLGVPLAVMVLLRLGVELPVTVCEDVLELLLEGLLLLVLVEEPVEAGVAVLLLVKEELVDGDIELESVMVDDGEAVLDGVTVAEVETLLLPLGPSSTDGDGDGDAGKQPDGE